MAVNSNFIKAKTRGLDLGDGIGPLGKAKLVTAKAIQSVLPAKVIVHVYYTYVFISYVFFLASFRISHTATLVDTNIEVLMGEVALTVACFLSAGFAGY